MKQTLTFLSLTVALTGCVGTYMTGRNTDTSAAYPSLHSVPDRPAKIDFKQSDQELEDFEADYAKKIEINETIRASTPRVTKPQPF